MSLLYVRKIPRDAHVKCVVLFALPTVLQSQRPCNMHVQLCTMHERSPGNQCVSDAKPNARQGPRTSKCCVRVMLIRKGNATAKCSKTEKLNVEMPDAISMQKCQTELDARKQQPERDANTEMQTPRRSAVQHNQMVDALYDAEVELNL